MYDTNNQVWLTGELTTNFLYDHAVCGEAFYIAEMRVRRTSGTYDYILIKMSERLIDVTEEWAGRTLAIKGQFRSYNKHEGNKTRLILTVFVKIWVECEYRENADGTNQIVLDGYICKPPIYRKTPLGREIADITFVVNRKNDHSDYIPCVCWGRSAVFAKKLEVGKHLRLTGRIQSRAYKKKLSEWESETRTAYEVSISRIDVLD